MGCLKTLSMTQAALGELPLQDAVYVASTNKIYGISGIYVVQLNATTGAVEATVRISSPVNNGARICYHAANDTLYASLWNEPNLGDTGLTHPNKDIYPINPATMTVGARLDVNVNTGFQVIDDFDSALNPSWGPTWIGSYGNQLYVLWWASSGYSAIRFDPTNFADRSTQDSDPSRRYLLEQAAMGPLYMVFPDPWGERFAYGPILWLLGGPWDYCDSDSTWPVAVDYCTFDSLYYAVDGNGNMIRINDITADDSTAIAIPPDVPSGVLTPDPCRIRWNTYNSLLYLPCMTDNAIVIYNPDTVAWTYKTGFANPVDLVFTPTKVWAVQNSPEVPLREVT